MAALVTRQMTYAPASPLWGVAVIGSEPAGRWLQEQERRMARDRRLRTVMGTDRMAWIVDERFSPQEGIWTVDVIRLMADDQWHYQRFKYDVETDVLYFWGEVPISEDEVFSRGLRYKDRFWPVMEPVREQRAAEEVPARRVTARKPVAVRQPAPLSGAPAAA